LAAEHVAAYGTAVGLWLRGDAKRTGARVLIGRDTRQSGPALLEQVSSGFRRLGHSVIDGGVLSTPAIQTLCREEGFDVAIVISASHNPAADNGLKFFGSDGRKLPDPVEEAIEAHTHAILQGNAEGLTGIEPGTSHVDPDAGARYLEFIASQFRGFDLSGVSLVLDCAHGAAWDLAPTALRELGATVLVKGADPDGSNINDGAGVFHVADLGPTVRERGAALGMALDGDADRVLLVDENGEVRDGDHMLGVLAVDLNERGLLATGTLVTTVMANLGLRVHLKNHGIGCDTVPVGDRFVSARMAETGATLGGEQSGHIIFQDGPRWYGDGLYSALRVLEVVQRTGRPLSELAAGIEKFPQVLINVPVNDKPPVDDVPELVEARTRAEDDLADEGRVVLRYSGTEALLRVMVEGRDLEVVKAHADSMVVAARRALG